MSCKNYSTMILSNDGMAGDATLLYLGLSTHLNIGLPVYLPTIENNVVAAVVIVGINSTCE